MRPPILTLTTDFGLADHYVGAMKGVILGIAPQARIVDIGHQAGAYAISGAAYLIAQAYACFPKETVHVIVVDPGVGSARRPILAKAAGQFFVAPDNGVLGMILAREKHQVRVLANPRYFREPVSRTFHGRDIFAPVAAHLAAGVPASKMGPLIDDYVRGDFAAARIEAGGVRVGRVLHVDGFGNVVTNFRTEDLPALPDGSFTLAAGRHRISELRPHYEGAGQGRPFAIAGSGGYVEISVNRGSAAQVTGCKAGSLVRLRVGRATRRRA
jgi:S-adenosyl-L-methionine hydrolase (adenosine-forming)